MYICDYRLDKSAHLFYKIHRNRYPVCTKPYAFDHFPKKLTPKRDFSVSLRPSTCPCPGRAAHACRSVGWGACFLILFLCPGLREPGSWDF